MVSKYLIAEWGNIETLVSNSNGMYYYVESDTDIHKAITSWLEQNGARINKEVRIEIEIDYALKLVKFSYHMFDEDDYPMEAEWKLIEITKP